MDTGTGESCEPPLVRHPATPADPDEILEAGSAVYCRLTQHLKDGWEDARAERKRQQIRRAAIADFLRNGYVGISTDDVATAASVSEQTIPMAADAAPAWHRIADAVTCVISHETSRAQTVTAPSRRGTSRLEILQKSRISAV